MPLVLHINIQGNLHRACIIFNFPVWQREYKKQQQKKKKTQKKQKNKKQPKKPSCIQVDCHCVSVKNTKDYLMEFGQDLRVILLDNYLEIIKSKNLVPFFK